MSILVVGISHRSAPVSVLEQVAMDQDGLAKLVRDVLDIEHVSEATVLATCNRCEVYAEVDRFHGSVEAISRMIGERASADTEDLLRHLYVHYDDGAVSHLLNVASGLDSMVIGESQILGQVRESLRAGQETSSIGPALNLLFQQALRVGKRTHAETDIDRAAPSVVTAALDELDLDLAQASAVVVGAGSMASLAVATLARAGAPRIRVANRTAAHADRLAVDYGAEVIDLDDVPAALAEADLLISCTGATGTVIGVDSLAHHVEGTPLAILDLALPRDVDPALARRAGVQLVNLEHLAQRLVGSEVEKHLNGVRAIVAEELTAFLAARRAASVTPTVVALRTMATGVVDAELERLLSRVPGLDPDVRQEVERTLRRTADKLLHQPTVRVQQLADREGALSYADALADLFALDPSAVEAVTRADTERGDR